MNRRAGEVAPDMRSFQPVRWVLGGFLGRFSARILVTSLLMAGWGGALAAPPKPSAAAASAALASPEVGTTGERLFKGETPLAARIWGHESDLPAHASRCTNCHARAAPPPGASAASGPATPLGPTLSAASLTSLQRRRGGPPSRFNEASFCRLVRTGVDPSDVLLPRVMPRYTLSDGQCHDLWQYLSNAQP